MPAFIINGPEIPERLLEAHEEGRVVFFCGAGISYPADLPGFRGLVDQIYEKLHLNRTPIEEETYKEKQFDRTLDLLERRNPGKRLAVREALASVLDTSRASEESTETHKALLQLATNKNDNNIRLVTTNFDQLFQRVITKYNMDVPNYPAPLLPVPKKSRWNGIVYLHGLLPTSIDEIELNRLVLTSGDFGLAYLTERWASRFVTELFRYYTVCFVGYSINDPVLRYMIDALAADELLGEARPEAFAFAGYETGKKEQAKVEWETKGVIPLLYEMTVDETLAYKENHSALHRTLKEWANTYQDGVLGKEMIIAEHASNPPYDSSKTDYAVGRVLWALTDWLAAKHFADLNPVPPLEWLGPLSERMGVIGDGTHDCQMDSVMSNLARWLTRHLNDPKLIIWLAENGGQLHGVFAHLICTRLDQLDKLIAKEDEAEINRIIANAPNAIPNPHMRTLLRLFITGRIKSRSQLYPSYTSLYQWAKYLKRDGFTPSLRIELREHLAPRVALRAPFHFMRMIHVPSEIMKIEDLVDWEIVLKSDDVHSALENLSQNEIFQDNLPVLLEDFTMLLRDAMDLMRELDGANDHNDLSYIYRPSIDDHPQNLDTHDWTVLITLVRDSWLATVQNNATFAKNVAEKWWLQPYPIFKRLVMFASTYDNIIPQKQSLDWLLEDSGWWLWSRETQHETMRLLASLATRLSVSEVNKLEQVVLAGPPREMFNEDMETTEWSGIVDRFMLLRLAKFDRAGGKWSEIANSKLGELQKEYPKIAEDERDEFPIMMIRSDERTSLPPTPQNCPDLIRWLKEHENVNRFEEDGWQQRCRDDFDTTSCALIGLSEEGMWPEERWRQALMAWSKDEANNESWNTIGHVLDKAPSTTIQSISNEVSWWLQTLSKTFEDNDKLFLDLCQRILGLTYNDEVESDNPLETAINRPVGLVTEALLHWCFRRRTEDEQGLPEEIKSIFTDICNLEKDKFIHGRVLLASRVVTLYRLDIEWTKKYLLPLFNWVSSTEARLVWEGFLWSPRLYRPFLADVKMELLEVAAHYEELGRRKGQYAEFLTFIALDPGDIFTIEELATAFNILPIEGLENAARALIRAIDGAKDKREEYWDNRIIPFLHKVWPTNKNITESTIPDRFTELCVVAGEAFPKAVEEMKYKIRCKMHSFYLFNLMSEKKICIRFPEESLRFLSLLVDDEITWLPKEFQVCLNEIKETKSELADDRRFIHLSELAKRYAIGY